MKRHWNTAPDIAWGSLVLVLFLLARLPILWSEIERNPDEGLMMAQALRFSQDLTPWLSVDTTTSGPLNSWILIPLIDGSGRIGYRTVHFFAGLLQAAILFFAWLGLRRLLGSGAALMGLAVGALQLALLAMPDFTHYASELLSCLLMATAFALYCSSRVKSGRFRSTLGRWVAAVLLGAVPWAKLQASVPAFALGVWMLVDCVAFNAKAELDRRQRFRQGLDLIGGALVPSILFLVWIWASGVWPYFRASYIELNLHYAGSKALAARWSYARTLLIHPVGVGAVLLLFCYVRVAAVFRETGQKTGLCLLGLLGGASAYTILSPVMEFRHYCWFALLPLVLHYALSASCLLELGSSLASNQSLRRAAMRTGFLGCTVLIPLGSLALAPQSLAFFIDDFWVREEGYLGQRQKLRESIVEALRSDYPGAKSLLVWGWSPGIHADTGLPPATRLAINPTLKGESRVMPVLRSAFLADLRASNPDIIVEVSDLLSETSPFMIGRPLPFDEYTAIRSKHYRLMRDGSVGAAGSYRVFLRTDLSAETMRPVHFEQGERTLTAPAPARRGTSTAPARRTGPHPASRHRCDRRIRPTAHRAGATPCRAGRPTGRGPAPGRLAD